MSGFKDHFSGHAGAYAAARPHYPEALFEWLAATATDDTLAWDAGCGNGQAALALARHFQRVRATDPSAEQIAHASPHPRVEYRVEAAEDCSLPAHSVSLVAVAQALHWFDHPRFFAQVQRVLQPGGVLAAWAYGLCGVSAAVDAVFAELYEPRLGPWWPPERRLLESGYADIAFPLQPLDGLPELAIELDWTLAQYLDYLRSWSSSRRCLRETGRDAVAEFTPRFCDAWGDPGRRRTVRWPIALKASRAPA